MSATADQPTPINLTNHAYWNLAGAGNILGHLLTVSADAFTPGDPVVPTGAVEPVAGTPLDYRVAEARLARARSQLRRRSHHRADAHRRASLPTRSRAAR